MHSCGCICVFISLTVSSPSLLTPYCDVLRVVQEAQNRAQFENGGLQCLQRCGSSVESITLFFSSPEKPPLLPYNKVSLQSVQCGFPRLLPSYILLLVIVNLYAKKNVSFLKKVLWPEFLKTFFWKKMFEVSLCICFNVTKRDMCKPLITIKLQEMGTEVNREPPGW